MRKELSSITVEILGVAENGLQILQVTDVKTGSVNDLLTPGRNLRIVGSKLKIAGDRPEVGVRFRSMEDPEAVYEVAREDLVMNKPSELIIVIPPLVADGYKLEVTTQYTNSTLLKESRTTIFDKVLTVS